MPVALANARLADLLAENLVHDFGAPCEGGHDLVPVDHLCGGGVVVPGQQRDRLYRHAICCEPPRVRWRLRCFGLGNNYSVIFAG
jgi:hypothetical protein